MVNGSTTPPGEQLPDGRADDPPASEPVTTVCPECGGVLTERSVSGMAQWECRVGHRYSPDSLADAQGAGVEAALWAAIRALEDRELLLTRMADQSDSRGQPRSARSFRRRARAAGEYAQQVRRALTQAAASTLRTIEDDDPGDSNEEESAA
jgi:two-component system chemotaxis response regulator CheB